MTLFLYPDAHSLCPLQCKLFILYLCRGQGSGFENYLLVVLYIHKFP